MSSFNISERLGIVLLGLGIYDAVRGGWAIQIGNFIVRENEFNFLRGILVFALSLLITGALSISHKLNSDLFSNSDKNVLTHSQEIHEKSGSYAWMSVALIAAAVALAYFGMGPQQAFLILAGVWFVNLAPFTNWLVSKL